MPRDVTFVRAGTLSATFTLPVATEEELLDFANLVRRAGGGNVIPALLPAYISDPTQCLIAKALNFECYIDVPAQYYSHPFEDGSLRWYMEVEDEVVADAVAAALGVSVEQLDEDEPNKYSFPLPKEIGNAAETFDVGAAFQGFVETD